MNPDLSIVVAVFNEDPRNLMLLIERLKQICKEMQMSHEVIFVNDGSRPLTTEALRQLAGEFDNIKLIELSRNFGQQAAITAGLDNCDGCAIINIDSDLQDPPELIPEMIAKWQDGYDVVYAQRSTRKDKLGKRLSAFIFYRILGSLSAVNIPWDTGDYRLMDRKVVASLKLLPENTRFLRGLVPWLGFKQIGIPINRDARTVGETGYTLRKLFALAMDGILSFSVAPLYLVATLGLFVTGAVLLGLVATAVVLMTCGTSQSILNVALLLIVGLIGGLQIISTGVVAVYLSKVLDEVRSRPTYLVGNKLGRGFDIPGDPESRTPKGVSRKAAISGKQKSELN